MYLVEALKLLFQRKPRAGAGAQPRPAEVTYFEKKPEPAGDSAPEESRGTVPPPSDGFGGVVDLLNNATGGLASTAVQLTQTVETVLDKGLGAGEGRASLAWAGGPAMVAVGAAQLTRNALTALGVQDEGVKKVAEQAVAAGPYAPAVLAAHAASAALRAISPEADRAVRDVVKLADISDPKQPAGAAFQAVTGAVKYVLGVKQESPPPPPPPPPTAAEIARINELTGGKPLAQLGLLGAARVADQVRKEQAPAAPVSPPTITTTDQATAATSAALAALMPGVKLQVTASQPPQPPKTQEEGSRAVDTISRLGFMVPAAARATAAALPKAGNTPPILPKKVRETDF